MIIRKRLYQLKKEFKQLYYSIVVFFSSRKNRVFPDFLIIGVQKGGTTWLYNILKAVPQVFLPNLKEARDPTEVRFYDERLKKGSKWYHELYRQKPNLIKGDKTPKYYIMPKYKLWLIKRLQPNVKIIIVLRCPITRAWSDATMNLKRFKGEGYSENRHHYIKYLHSKIHRGEYAKQLRKWHEVFPQEQIYITVYEEMIDNPVPFLKEIFEFLKLKEVNLNNLPINKKFNVNPKQEIPKEVVDMLRSEFKCDYSKLKKEYPNINFQRWPLMDIKND